MRPFYKPRPKLDTGFVCAKCACVNYRDVGLGDRACLICSWTQYEQVPDFDEATRLIIQNTCNICGYTHEKGAKHNPPSSDINYLRSLYRKAAFKELLAKGVSVAVACVRLDVSRRTADRYLAEMREAK